MATSAEYDGIAAEQADGGKDIFYMILETLRKIEANTRTSGTSEKP